MNADESHTRMGQGAEAAKASDRSMPACDIRLAAIKRELAEQRQATDRLAEARRSQETSGEQLRWFRERFYEREVLEPVFHTLIGIADRCRSDITGYQRELHQSGTDKPSELIVWLRRLRDARRADLLEVEGLLANFGVQRFQHPGEPGDRFDPKVQTCVKRIPTPDSELHRRVARRLRPAYRRADRVIRPECVSVYVPPTPPEQEIQT